MTERKNSLLTIDRLCVQFVRSTSPALEEITLEVNSGQRILIIGSNGSGKTTLLRAINGLIPFHYPANISGDIYFEGGALNSVPIVKRSQVIGTLLQDTDHQLLNITVEEEICFGMQNLGKPSAEIMNTRDQVLSRLEIDHLRYRQVQFLSAGEKKKVALASILAMRPRLLLLDEPLAALDPYSTDQINRLLRELSRIEGFAILVTENRLEAAKDLEPDTVFFLENGRIKDNGTIESVYASLSKFNIKKFPSTKTGFKPETANRGDAVNEHEELIMLQDINYENPETRKVIQECTFSLRKGDFVALLGANGAGKSTLMKIMIGLLKPSSGKIYLRNKAINLFTGAQIARFIGYVFENPEKMFFSATVEEEISFGPKNLGFKNEEILSLVEQAMAFAHLDALRKRHPFSLSYGEQKRLALACSLAMRCRILILDDLFAGLDVNHSSELLGNLRQLSTLDALIFSTQEITLVKEFANRTVILHDGKIVKTGTPEQCLSDSPTLEKYHLHSTRY